MIIANNYDRGNICKNIWSTWYSIVLLSLELTWEVCKDGVEIHRDIDGPKKDVTLNIGDKVEHQFQMKNWLKIIEPEIGWVAIKKGKLKIGVFLNAILLGI